jgi:hypothetical protein
VVLDGDGNMVSDERAAKFTLPSLSTLPTT